MKKFVSVLLVCVALVLVLDVNGTLANQAEQLAQNLFRTVQNILNPTPDVDSENFKVDLVFTQQNGAAIDRGQVLAPSHEISGMPTANTEGLWTATGVVDRFTCATNNSTATTDGTHDAYLRIVVAMKDNNFVYLNFKNSDDFDITTIKNYEIDGAKYTLHVFTYTRALKPGETTPPTLMQIAMDKSTTSEQLETLGSDFLRFKVMAIQASAFVDKTKNDQQMTYSEALNAAIPLDENFRPF
ncbi:MAG: hypothetical protein E7333_07665 [Clostridiales bacterium]|nr:hypothetical protein [Clostridiales bacterium]